MKDVSSIKFKDIENEDSLSLYRTVQSIEAAQNILLADLKAKIKESDAYLKLHGDLFAREETGEVVKTKLGQPVSLANPIGSKRELEQLQMLLKLKEDTISCLRERYENGQMSEAHSYTDADLRKILLGQI